MFIKQKFQNEEQQFLGIQRNEIKRRSLTGKRIELIKIKKINPLSSNYSKMKQKLEREMYITSEGGLEGRLYVRHNITILKPRVISFKKIKI